MLLNLDFDDCLSQLKNIGTNHLEWVFLQRYFYQKGNVLNPNSSVIKVILK